MKLKLEDRETIGVFIDID